MKNLAVIEQDLDLPELSRKYAVMIIFQNSRAQAYPMAASMARRASFYEEITQGKNIYHAVGFLPTEADMARCVSIAQLVGKLSGTVYAIRGRVFKDTGLTQNVLRCYHHSFLVEDHRAHCHILYPSQFSKGIAGYYVNVVPLAKGEQAILPCKYVTDWTNWTLSLSHPARVQDQFLALCASHDCDWCPRNNPEDLRIIARS